MRDGLESLCVVLIDDESRHLIVFVGDDGVGKEHFEGDVGERHLRRDALLVIAGGDPRQIVAGAGRRRLGKQFLERAEAIGMTADRVGIAHDAVSSCLCGGSSAPPGNDYATELYPIQPFTLEERVAPHFLACWASQSASA